MEEKFNTEQETKYTGINRILKAESLQTLLNKWYDGTFEDFFDDWKWIFTFSKKYKSIIIFYTVLGLVSSTLSLAAAWISKILINVIVEKQTENLWMLIAASAFSLVFHGSAVAVNEKAYLFTAKSGTGKTTHTDLWLKNIPGSFVVNGDKPILRIMDGTVFVCGTPWMGKEKMGCSRTVPLSGLCILNRGETNTIEKASLAELLPLLIGQAYRPPEGAMLIRTVKLLEQIGKSTELYRLSCNMEDEAAIIAYRGMCHDEI